MGDIKNIPKLTPLKSIGKKQTSAGFVQIKIVILFTHVPVFFCVIHPNAMLGSKLTEEGFRFFNWGFLTNQYQRTTILYNYIRGNSGKYLKVSLKPKNTKPSRYQRKQCVTLVLQECFNCDYDALASNIIISHPKGALSVSHPIPNPPPLLPNKVLLTIHLKTLHT